MSRRAIRRTTVVAAVPLAALTAFAVVSTATGAQDGTR